MQPNISATIRKNKLINPYTAIVVMAVFTNLKEPTLEALRKDNFVLAEIVKAGVIIEEAKLPITVDQLVMLIALSFPTLVTIAKITASDMAR